MFDIIFKFWRRVVSIFSSEWILTHKKIPNGGPVIIFRSIFSTTLVFLFILGILNLIDPSKGWTFSVTELRTQITELYSLFGVIFAGTYTLLYARYSSQWTYLANLYNQIKEIESSCASSIDESKLAEWKAGFIEDSDLLHLACKTSFVSIIKVWGGDPKVKEAFIQQCRGGENKYSKIMARAEESISIIERNIERLTIKSIKGQG